MNIFRSLKNSNPLNMKMILKNLKVYQYWDHMNLKMEVFMKVNGRQGIILFI